MNRRSLVFAGVLLGVLVLAVVLSGSDRRSGPPLSPRSTEPDGTRALHELLDDLGGEVRVDEELPAVDGVVVLLVDNLSRAQADDVERWVRRGGTLLVADAFSLFAPDVTGDVEGRVDATDCADLGVVGVGELVVSRPDPPERSLGVATRTFGTAPTGCGRTSSGALVDIRDLGDGTVIAVGGPRLFTNELIGQGDNAVFVASVAANTDTVFLERRATDVGDGDRGLFSLIGPEVEAMAGQLALALFVLILWRGRRLGRPVVEAQAVPIDSSEFTRAVARLLENNRRPERAAALLRDAARRDLAARVGLTADSTTDEVVEALSRVTTLTPTEVHTAVASPVSDDGALVTVAGLLTRIRKEILHGPATSQR